MRICSLAHADLYSNALGWITLGGEMAESLVQQGSFLTPKYDGIKVGSAKRTLVAGIPAIILCEKAIIWTISIERGRARSFIHWLTSMTQNFSGDRT